MSAGVKMPLSPTSMRSFGTIGASVSLTASVVSKVRRSRLLMPIRRDLQLQRPVELGLVVHLDQHVHAEVDARPSSSAPASASLTRRHDDQDAVGAERARLEHLIGLEHEILAQRRQVDGAPRRDQIAGAALEEAAVGQHRQAGGAAGLVGAGQAGGSKSARIRPLDGLAFLISAISAGRPAAMVRSSAARKPRGRRLRPCACASISAGGVACLGGGDLGALGDFDRLEDVAHRLSRSTPRSAGRADRPPCPGR